MNIVIPKGYELVLNTMPISVTRAQGYKVVYRINGVLTDTGVILASTGQQKIIGPFNTQVTVAIWGYSDYNGVWANSKEKSSGNNPYYIISFDDIGNDGNYNDLKLEARLYKKVEYSTTTTKQYLQFSNGAQLRDHLRSLGQTALLGEGPGSSAVSNNATTIAGILELTGYTKVETISTSRFGSCNDNTIGYWNPSTKAFYILPACPDNSFIEVLWLSKETITTTTTILNPVIAPPTIPKVPVVVPPPTTVIIDIPTYALSGSSISLYNSIQASDVEVSVDIVNLVNNTSFGGVLARARMNLGYETRSLEEPTLSQTNTAYAAVLTKSGQINLWEIRGSEIVLLNYADVGADKGKLTLITSKANTEINSTDTAHIQVLFNDSVVITRTLPYSLAVTNSVTKGISINDIKSGLTGVIGRWAQLDNFNLNILDSIHGIDAEMPNISVSMIGEVDNTIKSDTLDATIPHIRAKISGSVPYLAAVNADIPNFEVDLECSTGAPAIKLKSRSAMPAQAAELLGVTTVPVFSATVEATMPSITMPIVIHHYVPQDLGNSKATTISFLMDVDSRRHPYSIGGNPHNFIELFGGDMVEMTAFEPDARTFRGEYYYNTVLNQLFRKITATKAGKKSSIWKLASR